MFVMDGRPAQWWVVLSSALYTIDVELKEQLDSF